jgi:hypothetical protein
MRIGYLCCWPEKFLLAACSCLALPLAIALSSQDPIFPDCLNASPSKFQPTAHPECSKDAMKLRAARSSAIMRSCLALPQRRSGFIGCADSPFVTVPAFGLSNSKPTIYYPTDVRLAEGDYFAPLLHELGHVFQLKQVSSYERLKSAVDGSNERIELGADFLAGAGASRLGPEPKSFPLNLSLVTDYNNRDPNWYGRPEDRAAAFRFGFFDHEKQRSFTDAYADSQNNLFAQTKHM